MFNEGKRNPPAGLVRRMGEKWKGGWTGFGGRWFAEGGKAGFISKLVYTPRSWALFQSTAPAFPLRGYPSGFRDILTKPPLSRIKCREIFCKNVKQKQKIGNTCVEKFLNLISLFSKRITKMVVFRRDFYSIRRRILCNNDDQLN